MAGRRISDGDIANARRLVEDGASYAEASRITGISTDTLSRRLGSKAKAPKRQQATGSDAPDAAAPRTSPPEEPQVEQRRRPDPTPGSRSRRRAPSSGTSSPRSIPTLPTDDDLERMVARIAKAPAIPMATVFHCAFCAQHFVDSGGPLAHELVEMSKDDRDLRDILEWLHANLRRYAWAGMLVSYLGVPLVHHAMPSGVYGLVAPFAGMPPRTASSHEHARHAARPGATPPPQAATAPPPPPPAAEAAEPDLSNPFVGLDTDTLLAQARALGIQADNIEELMSAATEIFSGANGSETDNGGKPAPGSSILWPTADPPPDATAAEIRAATAARAAQAQAPPAPPHTDTGQ